ncbi:TRAP transporter substrate-binding protein DctP [Alteribacillus sp. JSM 102045]|uniref:TRAP transporter substrate-binding protein DctP n=1 Tax=Alteribacillus sp. JSM 102045 TaxID=1562101 RepID=UPI0035C089CF
MQKLKKLAPVLAGLMLAAACGADESTEETDTATSEAAEEEASDTETEEAGENETYTLKVGHIAPEDEAYALGMQEYAEAVEEETDGRVLFEIFGDGTLGGERELMEGVQLGNLDMSVVTTGVVTNFVTETTVLEFPFLFEDLDHAYEVMDGEIGQELLEHIEESGYKGIAFWENGMRHIANNKHPIESPEDLNGLKMRTIESELLIDTYEALGTSPTPMAFPEVYGGLQQGVIDGTDQSYGVMWSTGTYEQLDYLTENGLYYASATLLMNKDLYESMPADIQTTIVELGQEYAEVQREIAQELEVEQKASLEEEGVEIIPEEEVDTEEYRELVEPVYEKHTDEYGDYIERIQELAE